MLCPKKLFVENLGAPGARGPGPSGPVVDPPLPPRLIPQIVNWMKCKQFVKDIVLVA